MSNLWKALRDVSRDVDPTVGFEPSAHGLDDEGTLAGPPAAQEVSASPAKSQEVVPPSPELPTLPRPTAPLRRPLSAPRPRPPGVPTASATTAAEPKAPKERLAPLQSPLRRPLGSAPQFDSAKSNKVVRPPQFNPVAGPAAGPTWASPAGAVSATAAAPPEVRPPSLPSPPSGPDSTVPARPRLAAILESRLPTPRATVEPQSPPAAGPRSPAGLRPPTPPPPPTAPAVSGPPGFTAGAGAAPSSNGKGRPNTNGAPFSPPAGLPDALKPFAPGAPNIQMDVAALALSPRWKPGDDDVMPTDGHKGARRPRLRDRLPW
jgi:hypothetical protein